MREFTNKNLSILCPKCGKVLMNAGDQTFKDSTSVEPASKARRYDYLIVCNHCKCYVGIKSNLPRAVTIPLLKGNIQLV